MSGRHSDVTLCRFEVRIPDALYTVQPTCTKATNTKAAIQPRTIYSLVAGKSKKPELLIVELSESGIMFVVTGNDKDEAAQEQT